MVDTEIFHDRAKNFSSTQELLIFQLINGDLNHFVFGEPLGSTELSDASIAMFGMGCFWGVEKLFWNIDGVSMTAVGYSAGSTQFPNYKLVCTQDTGHNEVVLIHFRPGEISFKDLLTIFWESHDPTQGMRQGNDMGSQYRSGIYTFSKQDLDVACDSRENYSAKLKGIGLGPITTEILPATNFYYAEEYHQQYLAKNPDGYCSLRGTGIKF